MSERSLAAQARTRELLRDRTATLVLAAWDALPGYTGDVDVDAFVARILPTIIAGQRTTASTTTAYIGQVIAEALGESVGPLAQTIDVTTLRGADPAEVYQRPFHDVWRRLKEGLLWRDAVAVGRDRLVRLVDDDLSLAHRHASRLALVQDDRVVGYRRVIRPELAKGGTCGLCIAASDRRYNRANLLPIHTRCGCEVMPIVDVGGATVDPGREINGRDLSDLYASVPGTKKAELSKARFVVHEHGELGPVLRRPADNFVGPGDLMPAA